MQNFILIIHCLPGILERLFVIVVEIKLVVPSRCIDVSVNIHIAVALGVVQLPALLGDVRRTCRVVFWMHVAIDHYERTVDSLRPHLVVESGDDVLLG